MGVIPKATAAEGEEMGNAKYKPLCDAFGYLMLAEDQYDKSQEEGYRGGTLGQYEKELAMLRFVKELRKVI